MELRGGYPLSNCIGVSVSSCKSCKTTGVRPNVPIIRYYTVHLQGIRPRGSICEILKRELYRWVSIEFFR